jgi:cytochrome c
MVLMSVVHVLGQTSNASVGRPPSVDDLRAIDIEVMPDGRGLPPGGATAEAGKVVYATRCAACHGRSGKEGPDDVLAGGRESLKTARPLRTLGSYWPYATTVWDYINRTMPFGRPRSLPADDVYAVTAYLLFLNGIIEEREIVSQTTLPRIRMPNRDGFVPDPRPDIVK